MAVVEHHSSNVTKRLKKNYLLALAILLTVLLLSQIIQQLLIYSNQDDSHIVNIAGRQRMLSQEISKAALGLYYSADTNDGKDHLQELSDSLALWTQSHEDLLNGNATVGLPNHNSPQILAKYEQIRPYFEAMKDAAASIIRIASNPGYQGSDLLPYLAVITSDEHSFLKGMDEIVALYDLESQNRAKNVRYLDLILFLTALVVIGLVTLSIFFPSIRLVRTSLEKEEQNTQHLQVLDRFFQINPDLMSIADDKAHFLKLNDAWSKVLGYTLDEIKEQSYLDFIHPDDLMATLTAMEELSKGKQQIEFVNRYRKKDGTYRSIEWHAMPIGTLNFAVARDITDELEIQKKVRDALEFNKTILDAAPMGVLLFRSSGECILANPAAERITSWNQETLLAMNFLTSELWLAAGLSATAQRAMESKRTQAVTVDAAPYFDRESWVECILSPVSIAGERHLLFMLHDVSGRQKAARELSQTNDKLKLVIDALEKSQQNSNALREMGAVLQVCKDQKEALKVVSSYVPLIFPGSKGALYLPDIGSQRLSAAAGWGEDMASQPTLEQDACWGLKRKQPHLASAVSSSMLCRHMDPLFQGIYLDVPMTLLGESMAILHLEWPMIDELEPQIQAIATVTAEHISLALNNITLREQLLEQSIRDPLTGAYNRRFMLESFERELTRCSRYHTPLGVMVLDVDHFKKFNDTYGHSAGDLVLVSLQKTLEHHVRKEDIICRMGGEEFAVILPNTARETVVDRAEEIRQAVSELALHLEGTDLGRITVSIGISIYAEHGKTQDELLKIADDALYRAKEQGRNRVIVGVAR